MVLNTIVEGFEKKTDDFEIFTSTDGFDAGCKVCEIRPDLIVLDIFLPGVKGFEVCRKAKEKCGSVKIISITGFDSEENKKKIMEAGADAYFAKPFDIKEIVKTAEKMFQKVVTYRVG